MEEDVADLVSGLYGHSDATELDSEIIADLQPNFIPFTTVLTIVAALYFPLATNVGCLNTDIVIKHLDSDTGVCDRKLLYSTDFSLSSYLVERSIFWRSPGNRTVPGCFCLDKWIIEPLSFIPQR